MRISDWSSDVCSSDLLERKSNSSFPTLGWLTADAETLDVIGARLRDLAISSSPLADADLRFRQAAGGLRFACHNGISHEIVYGRGDGAPYQPASDVTGFVTGEGGMGHTARSEERRVGQECVSPCRSRRPPYH